MRTLVFSFSLLFPVLLASCSGEAGKVKGGLKLAGGAPSALSAGFAAVDVTPSVPDRWTDADNDAAYDPEKGDTFTDGNGNGLFDPVWIAGFGNRRAANGIHDRLWARTMAVSDGKTTIAMVSVDVIGIMNNAVEDIRNLIGPGTGLSYLVVTSTHSHEGPDLLGLWGSSPYRSGVDKAYFDDLKKGVALSVKEALSSLRPARLEFSEDLTSAGLFMRDSRLPEVFDQGIRVIRAVDASADTTLGTFISWGNHPETLWGKNLIVTSDFPHYLRTYVEKGLHRGDSLVMKGAGGIAVYSTAAIGGLMTTSPGVSIPDPFTGKEYREPSFEKADAQGKQLAIIVLSAMKKPALVMDSAAISLISQKIQLPLKNKLFRLGRLLKVIDRGRGPITTELAAFTIGPATFATVPGEIYPEIINGGIENPSGADFATEPLEVPPVREMMPGRFRFILGLANDEIGYIIPKSQWDVKAPFAYGREEAQYGEENSMGPETASIIHRNLGAMLGELKK